MDDKENTAPLLLGQSGSLFDDVINDAVKKGRSKSMGPATLPAPKAMDRRKSALPVAVRGILPNKQDAERKAARRKSMADRRVSFAPEATLHTWDVIDYIREHTNSTGSTEGYHLQAQQDESDLEESEESEEEDEDDENTSASIGMDLNNITQTTSAGSASSTSSSMQLERNLRLAADMAGTRGIEYDEHGDMSMDIAEDEITNAFQPWVNREEDSRPGSAVLDQENLDPFLLQQSQIQAAASPGMFVFSAGTPQKQVLPSHVAFSDDEQTMDFTAIAFQQSSPTKTDRTPTGLKRSIAQVEQTPQQLVEPPSPKRRCPSSPFQEQEDQSMQFTQAFGGIQRPDRVSFNSVDENEEMSMELTTVLGGMLGSRQHTADQTQQSPQVEETADLATPTKSTPRRRSQNANTPTSNQSTRSRRQSASPGRRSSARLRNSLARIPEQPSDGVEEEQATPTVQTRASPHSASKQQVQPPQLTEQSQQSPVEREESVDMMQSSPFHSVVASPAPPSRPATYTAPPVVFSPLAMPVERPVPSMLSNIRMLSTPRKETLREVSLQKRARSPVKPPRSAQRDTRGSTAIKSSPSTPKGDSLEAVPYAQQGPSLQEFLDEAGIRFMDLTTSKRRATIAPTPSKVHAGAFGEADEHEIPLDEAIISAACTEPELELYKHACNELRRYIDGGKSDIKALEDATLAETPMLIQQYMVASREERAVIDANLRELKTNARLRSKEMWYSWRSNLVDDLMKVLQSIAEGLLSDDDNLQEKENIVSTSLPKFLEERARLQAEVDALQAAEHAIPIEQREELEAVREQLSEMFNSMTDRRALLEQLETQLLQRDARLSEIHQDKSRCLAVIERSDALKAAASQDSAQIVAELHASIRDLETSSGWRMLTESASSFTIALQYKSELEFRFNPLAFGTADTINAKAVSALSLAYVGPHKSLPTTERFFLQLLRANLHILSQTSSNVSKALHMISSCWDTCKQVSEALRCMSIATLTEASIVNDECLKLSSSIFLAASKTKLHAIVKYTANTEQAHEMHFMTGTDVKVVYGSLANVEQFSKHFSEAAAAGPQAWALAVRQLYESISKTGSKIPRRIH